MNTEATLISAVCKNKDISTLLADNVDELFTSHRDIWESLKSYYFYIIKFIYTSFTLNY